MWLDYSVVFIIIFIVDAAVPSCPCLRGIRVASVGLVTEMFAEHCTTTGRCLKTRSAPASSRPPRSAWRSTATPFSSRRQRRFCYCYIFQVDTHETRDDGALTLRARRPALCPTTSPLRRRRRTSLHRHRPASPPLWLQRPPTSSSTKCVLTLLLIKTFLTGFFALINNIVTHSRCPLRKKRAGRLKMELMARWDLCEPWELPSSSPSPLFLFLFLF